MHQTLRCLSAVGCRRCRTVVTCASQNLQDTRLQSTDVRQNAWNKNQPLYSTNRRYLSSASENESVFKSPKPIETFQTISVHDYMFSRFAKFGDKTALVDSVEGTTYTYSQLEDLVRRVGSFLNWKGLLKGDVVCYYGTNNPEFLLLMLGCALTGIVLTTANPAYTCGELKRHMEQSGSKLLVTTPPLVKNARETGIKNIIVVGTAEGCEPFDNLLKDDRKRFPANVRIDLHEDIFVMPFSSGTTGLPKGVMLSHFNVVSNLRQFRRVAPTTTDDNNFGVLPFYHIYGMVPVLLATLQDGGTLVTTTGFDPEGFLKVLEKHQITQLHSVPPIVLFLLRHPIVDKFDLSRLRSIICGAAPLGVSLTHEFKNKRKIAIKQGYGLTETSPVVAMDEEPITAGSVGRLVPNTEAKFINPETGEAVGRNCMGELCIRGPQNMKGYLNNEKATREMIDTDGWLHTGDLGHMMDNDCIVISDRLKELIKYKGLQVAPAELEDIIHKHPAVQDVAVIGMPDDRAGELPRAYVVLKPEACVHAHDIINYVDGQVSDYKKLRGGVEFLKEIPKSPSGKILRRVLKDRLSSTQK